MTSVLKSLQEQVYVAEWDFFDKGKCGSVKTSGANLEQNFW